MKKLHRLSIPVILVVFILLVPHFREHSPVISVPAMKTDTSKKVQQLSPNVRPSFGLKKDEEKGIMIGQGIWSLMPRRTYIEDEITETQLQNYLVERHIMCDRYYRAGNLGDGGWDVCEAPSFKPKNPCLVYSFGINYDFSFDDAMVKKYGCNVYSFDPSMKKMKKRVMRGKYIQFVPEGLSNSKMSVKGWKMNTLDGFMEEFGHTNKTIDYLKMDIERSEWQAMPQIIDSGTLKQVKQLGLEIHRSRMSHSNSTTRLYHLLQLIEAAGFRKWHLHFNPVRRYTTNFGTETSRLIEMYFLNLKFLSNA